MRKVLIILFFAINSVLSATNYYVKNGGNDAASGTSDATAWANHPWMSTWKGNTKLVAGDNVFMKRGDSWSISTPFKSFITVGQSGNSGRQITTTWYGSSGSKPLIQITGDYPYSIIEGYGKSFITFDNLEIKHFSAIRDLDNGQTGIKFGKDASGNVPHDWIISNCDIHNIPNIGIYGNDDSYNIIIGNNSAISCATIFAYSNQIYDCGYGGIVLLGRDPVTNHSHFDIYYNYIHNIDYGGGLRDAYGISFSMDEVGSGQGYSTGWPSYCIAKFNRIEAIPGHTGADCHGGKNIYFQDNYIYNCLHGIIAQAADRSYSETAILDNVYIERNTIENSGNSVLDHYVFIYVLAENVLHRATNCNVNDNILFYTSRPSSETSASGISIYNVDGGTIEGNEIFNGPIGSAAGGILFYSNGTNKVKNVIVKNNWIYNWDKAINLYPNSLDGNIAFFDNIIYSHYRPFEVNAGTISNNITIYNNTILTNANAPQPYVVDFVGNGAVTIANGASLSIKNNIIGSTSTVHSGIYVFAPATINGTFTCDYNLYWNSTSSTPFSVLNASHTWTDWKGYGYDTHSLNSVDPLFMNKSGSYSKSHDFILQSTSPAINKGTVVNEITQDFFGNPRDGTPDIGATEYNVSVQTISVTGEGGSNTIATDKGTLQLISSVLPSDASNKTVTWSITNGTGQATISSSGLVSAIGNGTVTAVATATDGSGANGTLFISILNQTSSVNPGATPVNQPPVVTISNPAKGNKYEKLATITVDAVAYDPDGTIVKVEFYCGSEKLVVLTSPPYSYIWKDIETGTYSITVNATDNLNATTTSSPVEFEVANSSKYDADSDILNLYPNPNDGHFSIKFINLLQNEKSNIVISDITGKQIYNGSISKEETLKQLDLSNSKSGIYLMMIYDKEILVTKKFIKN